jgi:drug/metabolite transporter (DMT)-like permease
VFEDAFLPFTLSISRFAFAIKIAFYFFPSPQFTAKQSKKNILFCISLCLLAGAGVLAYFPSRQNLFTDIHRESVNFSGKMRPELLLFGINFNLHA